MVFFGVGIVFFYFDMFSDDIYVMVIVVVVFYLFNYVIFKGSLFMMVGIVDYEIGMWDIR